MKKYFYILTLCVLALSSCKKEEVGGTAVQSLANEWYVQVTQINTATGAVIDDTDKTYYTLSTYNTADNSPTTMWMDDSQSYYGLKAKVNVDLANKTFSVNNGDEQYDAGVKVTITNGKVITNGAVGPASKALTDAISYDARFSNDPDNITYRFKGYGRTRFPDDDH
jgi:hypothetical protein